MALGIYILSVLILILGILFEGLSVKGFWLFILFWLVPVVISQDTNLPLNESWDTITYLSVYASIVGFSLGFISGKFYPNIGKVYIRIQRIEYFNLILQIIALLSLLICYISLGYVPLMSGDILGARMDIQRLSPVAWTLAQSSFLSANFRFFLLKSKKWRFWNEILLVIIGILILLTAWRNFLLMYLLFILIPYLFERNLSILKFFIFGTSFLVLFTLIGYTRGDLGDSFTLKSSLQMIGFYFYPNFLNFQEAVIISAGQDDSHFYTFQFLVKPILDYLNFSVAPTQASIGAFNVSTGLNPLYQDGGIINILLIFYLLGFLIIRLQQKVLSPLLCFWRSMLVVVIVFFHNGWVLLNFMPTLLTIFYFIYWSIEQSIMIKRT